MKRLRQIWRAWFGSTSEGTPSPKFAIAQHVFSHVELESAYDPAAYVSGYVNLLRWELREAGVRGPQISTLVKVFGKDATLIECAGPVEAI